MVAIFGVLSDDRNRAILDVLAQGERPVGELVGLLSLSQPTVSRHLRTLRDTGLVECRTEGQRRIYRVTPGPLRDVDDWIAPYRLGWGSPPNALERHVEIMGEADAGF